VRRSEALPSVRRPEGPQHCFKPSHNARRPKQRPSRGEDPTELRRGTVPSLQELPQCGGGPGLGGEGKSVAAAAAAGEQSEGDQGSQEGGNSAGAAWGGKCRGCCIAVRGPGASIGRKGPREGCCVTKGVGGAQVGDQGAVSLSGAQG